MNTNDFNYNLPAEQIAQTPLEPRDGAKMLTYTKANNTVYHKHFYDILSLFNKGDLLILNNTKVLKARLFANLETGGKVEILLLKRNSLTQWEVLAKPAKKLKIGTKLLFGTTLSAKVLNFLNDGIRVVEFSYNGVFEDIIDKIGTMPLPPYISQKLTDENRYQTVYCKVEGSSAAPTAGLHFTPKLIESLKQKGVEFCEVTLNVGLGTFRPVKVDEVEKHHMHSEYYEITESTAKQINNAIDQNRRIIAVGTTTVRVLESASNQNNRVEGFKGNTDIFIYPGYKFKIVKNLITNFHLPESTLLMLISALIGREKVLELYNCAVAENYRFFSFGDAMLILE